MDREELNELETKQDFLRPENLTEEEEEDLLQRTEPERKEFSGTPPLSSGDIGSLERVEENSVIYLANTVENPYLTQRMNRVLSEIESKFEDRRAEEGLVVIVSLARIGEEQMKANPKIAETGTHPKGEAIDFAGKFMKREFPDSAAVLEDILLEMEEKNKIHFINEEESTAFWHVSRCKKG